MRRKKFETAYFWQFLPRFSAVFGAPCSNNCKYYTVSKWTMHCGSKEVFFRFCIAFQRRCICVLVVDVLMCVCCILIKITYLLTVKSALFYVLIVSKLLIGSTPLCLWWTGVKQATLLALIREKNGSRLYCLQALMYYIVKLCQLPSFNMLLQTDKGKADHLYSALHGIQTTLKRSVMDHTV